MTRASCRVVVSGFVLATGLVLATPSEAELVFLRNGRTLSVTAHEVAGDRVVLTLRAGGEVVCPSALVDRIEPDEVPWPEPSSEPAASPGPVVMAPTGPFGELIEPLARVHGVDPSLVRAVVATESAFEPRARSPKGAMGLMQLMPITARQYAVRDPYDPTSNLSAGIRHLKFLLDRYDIRIALAAYNAGEATVLRHGGIPPFRETREYVNRVLRRLAEYRRVAAGQGSLPGPEARPALASPTS
ncbi:MAG: lytic transglycosylase domain-containing protein [Vicinamibacterales bacterium]